MKPETTLAWKYVCVILVNLTSISLAVINAVFVVQQIGWAALLPWEYIHQSFMIGYLAPLALVFASVGRLYLANIKQQELELKELSIYSWIFLFIFSVIALAIHWSWPFLGWIIIYLGTLTWVRLPYQPK